MADGRWPVTDGPIADGQKLMADRRHWYMIAKRMKDMIMMMVMMITMMTMTMMMIMTMKFFSQGCMLDFQMK